MWTLYSLGIHVYAFLVFVASFFNAKAKKRFVGQRQTFKYLKSNVDKNAKYVWFHAASLGEFEQARPLMEELRRRKPEYKILLTFFSPSGYEVRKNYEGADLVCYMPLDTIHNAERFVRRVKPVDAIFVKYEFWPNFLFALRRRGIPTYIVSAHFRDNQAFFKWYGVAYAKVLKFFNRLFVQDMHSVELLNGVGIENVTISGDTRFDRVVEIASNRKELPLVEAFVGGQKAIVAGSSWPKDEDMLIKYAQDKGVKLILAPHEIHESHLAEIERKWNETGGAKPIVRYTAATDDNVRNAGCLIINNFGMLSSIYYYGTVAYVGGGFGVGIHNLLEAAVYGMPVVFGPNHTAFREALKLKECGGGISIASYEDFEREMNRLIANPEKAGAAAGNYVSSNKGASDKILGEIFL